MMNKQPKVGEFCWNELATPHVQAAKEFYGKVFGWEFQDHEMEDTTYTMIKLRGEVCGGIWAIPKDKQQQILPHWVTYILVDTLETALEKARKHGATVLKPASQAGEMGRFAIISDPTGAHIALWEPSAKSKNQNK